MDNIINILLTALGTLVLALVTWATNHIVKWLNVKIDNNQRLKCLETITNIVAIVVKSTTQTYVNSLKGTVAWTKEAQKTALLKALATAKEMLSTEMKDYITKNFGSIDLWLEHLIEAEVFNNRQIA